MHRGELREAPDQRRITIRLLWRRHEQKFYESAERSDWQKRSHARAPTIDIEVELRSHDRHLCQLVHHANEHDLVYE